MNKNHFITGDNVSYKTKEFKTDSRRKRESEERAFNKTVKQAIANKDMGYQIQQQRVELQVAAKRKYCDLHTTIVGNNKILNHNANRVARLVTGGLSTKQFLTI